ncbi:tryptophan synthase beta subunit-like PLP-dependent enzyme [Lactarius deliciosus]|nr:tryptophan synthase beta subunit-like PLP-dependent enzyme [Lactarius deliciosus]
MKYFSTRGGDGLLSFEEAVLTGLAPDGGLYIPEYIPSLPQNWQEDWKSYSFVDLSVAILSLYISPDELSKDELRALVNRSYSTFRHPDVTPVTRLSDKEFVLELFHGPTFAFKDVALQLLGNLFEFFLARKNARKSPGEQPERLTVVGATSGDTGRCVPSGVNASYALTFRSTVPQFMHILYLWLERKKNVSIFILHPKGRVSPVQEAQMTTVTDSNVHNVAVRGMFDACQDIVKALFTDRPFNERHHLGAVNSINWARILAQTVYYFLTYFHVRGQIPHPESSEVQFVVPTGNFGDVLAGYYAKRMGLPMGKLVVATNSNDILARFWRSGRYEKVSSSPDAAPGIGSQADGGVQATLSPAMDILVSSNFERLLWYLAYEASGATPDATRRSSAGATIDAWMKGMKRDGRVEVPVDVLELARQNFLAERVSDDQTLETIKQYFIGNPSYIADPHTAVGLSIARILATKNTPSVVQVILSTAHPAKFSEVVTKALATSQSFNFERDVLPQELRGLLEKERRVIDVDEPSEELIKKVIESKASL